MSRFSNTPSARAGRAARRKELVKSLRLAWSSLHTHLSHSVNVPKKKINEQGNEEWNGRCVRDYGQIIATLSVELHELTKVDFPDDFEEKK